MAAEAAIAPFRQGLKEVYLPQFSLILHRTRLPPKFATFTVPLWFNKLDLRDYLYNAYDVRILSVRSYVKLQPISQGKKSSLHGEPYPRPQYRRWHRPRSIKRMTVELEQPFVWPTAPEKFDAYNKEQRDMAEDEQKEIQERQQPTGDTKINEERRTSMREQAKALLEGRAKWKPVSEGGFGTFPSR